MKTISGHDAFNRYQTTRYLFDGLILTYLSVLITFFRPDPFWHVVDLVFCAFFVFDAILRLSVRA